MRISLAIFASLLMAGQPVAAQAEYDAAFVAKRIGELSAIYPAYAACADTPIAKSNFENLKYNVREFFGDDAAERMQTNFDKMINQLSEFAPSIRRETAIDMECHSKEQSAAQELATLFEDLEFFAKKASEQAE
ncbi:hypothetical protein [Altererythrobacter aquiaggeris]|uniref:hypothetical protein n=1 Tax=Aestuarierythrobacter aquiaggeris TaxID=1898396 RepID=UPI00301A598D